MRNWTYGFHFRNDKILTGMLCMYKHDRGMFD